MSTTLYDEGLRLATPLQVRTRSGSTTPLPLHRWRGPARGADTELLDRARGSVLDVGCGPGRLTVALHERGLDCLGIDTAPAAAVLTRLAGGRARQVSIFDLEPAGFDTILLIDGNIGIGGNPQALLERCRSHLSPGGVILLELDPPGARSHTELLRLEAPGRRGRWFPWSHLAAPDLSPLADLAGLTVSEEWSAVDHPVTTHRFFAQLRCP